MFPWAQFWSRFLRLESPVNHKRGKWAWLYHYFRSQMIALYYTSTYPAIDVHMQAVIISIFFSSTCTKWTSIVLAIATFNLQWYLSALIRTFFLRKKYFWWIFTRIEIMLYCNMRNAWHSHMLDLVHWPKAVSKSLLNIFFLFFFTYFLFVNQFLLILEQKKPSRNNIRCGIKGNVGYRVIMRGFHVLSY